MFSVSNPAVILAILVDVMLFGILPKSIELTSAIIVGVVTAVIVTSSITIPLP